MPDGRNAPAASPPLGSSAGNKKTPGRKNAGTGAGGEEATIKVASKKETKPKAAKGIIKLRKPAPKHSNPGNWKDGMIIDGMSTQ